MFIFLFDLRINGYTEIMHERALLKTSVGVLEITGTEQGITSIEFTNRKARPQKITSKTIARCVAQLQEYFEGSRTEFDVPLVIAGTPFQEKVWKKINAVTFGHTISYGSIAGKLTKKGGFQAVGQAIGANKHCIVIPCHRITASNGGMGGYSGGLEKKKWLLRHEKAKSPAFARLSQKLWRAGRVQMPSR